LDTNFHTAKFPTRGDILHTLSKQLEIKQDGKKQERFTKEEKIEAETLNTQINDLVNRILELFYEKPDAQEFIYLQKSLHSFLNFYNEFSLSFESCNASKKQLIFLLWKDFFIPCAAALSSIVFRNTLPLLINLEPSKDKPPMKLLFDWIDRKATNKKSLLQYLVKKHLDDNEYDKGEDTIRKNVASWISGGTTPEIKSIERLVKYISPDLDGITSTQLQNTFIYACLIQDTYQTLSDQYTKQEADMLTKHFFLLSKLFLMQQLHRNPEKLRILIYKGLFSHIDPNILNRDLYWDEYFMFIQYVLHSDIPPKKLIKKAKRTSDGAYYLDEHTAFKYMPVFLPIYFLLQERDQQKYKELFNDFMLYVKKTGEGYSISDWKQNIQSMDSHHAQVHHVMAAIYAKLLPKQDRTPQDLIEVNSMFQYLQNNLNVTEDDYSICFLKSRYYAFTGNSAKALECCLKSYKSGKQQMGEHAKDLITEGILLSAKCKSKRNFNYFLEQAKIKKIFKYGMLKIPANTKVYTLIEVSQEKPNFERLIQEYDHYWDGSKFYSSIQ
jgi:hypothetical protein